MKNYKDYCELVAKYEKQELKIKELNETAAGKDKTIVNLNKTVDELKKEFLY